MTLLPLQLSVQQLTALRQALQAADYTSASVRGLIGDEEYQLLVTGSRGAALQNLQRAAASALKTLCALFVVGETVSDADIRVAFSSLSAAELVAAGVLMKHREGYTAAVSLNAVQISGSAKDWLLFSDLDDHLRHAPVREDHVMGVGGATRSLISLLPAASATPFPVAADIGTGCGIVAFQLAARATRVIATDISARALQFASCNAVLNDIENVEFRQGDLFMPLQGDRVDLLASNPPFVISPVDVSTPDYRTTGEVGDALSARFVRELPAQLKAHGQAIALVNWETHRGNDFAAAPAGWLSEAQPFQSAWLFERERLSPAAYASLWARDGGAHVGGVASEHLISAYLADFAIRQVTAISFGVLYLTAAEDPNRTQNKRSRQSANISAGSQAVVTPACGDPQNTAGIVQISVNRAPYGDSAVLGEALAAAFTTGAKITAMSDAELLTRRPVLAVGVREQRIYQPGQADPQEIWFATTLPFQQQYSVDTALAALLGASDGELTIAQITLALAEIFAVPKAALEKELIKALRRLAYTGLFTI